MLRRTWIYLDVDLLESARAILGTTRTTDTVHGALAEIVTRHGLRELADEGFDDLTPEALAELRRTRG
jgi:hypothetical protein